jgi:hypothetical protein
VESLNENEATTIKLIYPFSSGSLLDDHCSGVFLNEVTRIALLTVVLGITVVLATGCASMGHGVSARLTSPVTDNQHASDVEENDTYQPARSPAFSDFFGS